MSQPDTEHSLLRLRGYQYEMYEKSMRANVIVAVSLTLCWFERS